MGCGLPVGVFDSGVGGLTVAKEIMGRLPGERILYFGDTARVPYGSKSKETVTEYSRQIMRFLISQEVKVVVVACNTASALAIDAMRREFEVPILDVVDPGARTAAEVTKNGSIGVIGTEGTIRSGMYSKFLYRLNPDLNVYSKACPLFVPLVEEGWIYDSVTREVARRYLEEFQGKGVDTIVLGCTHYPLLRNLLKDVVREVLGEGVTLVNPAVETAKNLKQLLSKKGLLAGGEELPEHTFYVSDGAEKFRSFANSILLCNVIETKDVAIKTFE
ncbi:MAG: glutamate racemase [Lachnospiraceae bacterium]|nr:glutamate racemase [Lachnospiraceae bacterium]